MISDNINAKPCLVEAGQGFTVYYKERYLYSKYAPEKAILKTIEDLRLLEGTLILARSPALWIGLKELISKLPEDCLILAVEDDAELFNFSKSLLEDLISKNNEYSGKILFSSCKDSINLLSDVYRFRRVVSLDMSGGVSLNKDSYQNTLYLIQNMITAFWKNRVTLVKLGRLFSRNFFKNLKNNPAENNIPVHSSTFSNPIVVFGAGETTEQFLQSADKNFFQKCTIIAVDAVLPVLVKNGITPDFTVGVESQLAIEKAYIGCNKTGTILLRDLTSRPAIKKNTTNTNLYFFSEYTQASFLEKAKGRQIMPVILPPLGSVGLSAVYIALVMRKSADVPVFITGLDFSFSTGKTHANGAPAHTTRLLKTYRMEPVENYNAAFRTGARLIFGKNNIPVITDASLSGYGELFKSFFSGTPNMWDTGFQGFDLGIPVVSMMDFNSFIKNFPLKTKWTKKNQTEQNNSLREKTSAFISEEKSALIRLKDLLINGNNCSPSPRPDLKTEISTLLNEREYLYLHFPDGWKSRPEDLSFLKRVRSEIDFFLKDMETID